MDVEYLRLAQKLAIPYEIVKNLSKKELFILEKKFPDEIEQYWDLKTFPIYMIEKYNLKPTNAIIPSTNATQKDYELFLAWKLARFISKLDSSNTHYALMLPKHDRGIECYIRCLDVSRDLLVAVPIQICDIVFTEQLLGENDYEKVLFELAVKAKSKPVDCDGAILLMNLRGDGKVNINTTADRFRLREMFETIKWSYRKIIFLS